MKKIYFAFGIHCHQPVGNFDFVFDEAFHRAYQPFLNVAEKFPEFKMGIHYSGILLEWIQTHYPDHIAHLRRMGDKGQVEFLTGGFYEPILSAISQRDAVGQIEKQTKWIKENFGKHPRGMWLAERVWEPTLPATIRKAAVEYSVIDDAHFKYSGLQNEDLLGYYITEDRGSPVFIFPISQKLRYTIPFQDPRVTLDYLRQWAGEDERLIVFADDGEKFGVWPGTYDFVYKQNWLERFFELILKNRDWIQLVHFSEAIDNIPPRGRIYLPTASYAEMMHWALLPRAFREYEDFEHYLKKQQLYDRFGVFVRGGFWRNFLAKYPESNQMHKKMLYLSEKAWELKEKTADSRVDEALDHLWAGQCNCPYWHGVFGGLYLGHIRHAVYQEMIQSGKLLRQVEGNNGRIHLVQQDYNLDGFEEIIVETDYLNLYFEPNAGGRLTELDYLPANFNILNTMSRREEGYHYKLLELAQKKNQDAPDKDGSEVASIHDIVLTKEAGLEKYLNYDIHERKSLVDHFLDLKTTLDNFQAVQYREEGEFYRRAYRLVQKEIRGEYVLLSFVCDGYLQRDGERIPLTVQKDIQIPADAAELEITYKLRTSPPRRLAVRFGVEFNFSLLAGYAEDRYYLSKDAPVQPANLASKGEMFEINHLGLVDEYFNIQVDLTSEKPARVWRFPIETISLSEAGFERVYQSSAVLLLYEIELEGEWEVKIHKKIGEF